MKVCVVGLGEVGSATYEDLLERNVNVVGVDIKERINELTEAGFKVTTTYPPADLYSVCVYSTEQVFEVVKKIPKDNDPLIVIESCIKPGSYIKLKKFGRVVLFGHRFNPNDKEHRVFNLTRIIGSDDEDALETVIEFYRPLMDVNVEIITHAPEVCEVSRCLENSTRYVNIALAENLKILCDQQGIDFNEVRKAVSSKWNTPILEARDGIGLTCLPKDMGICIDFFGEDNIFGDARKRDHEYKESLKPKTGKK